MRSSPASAASQPSIPFPSVHSMTEEFTNLSMPSSIASASMHAVSQLETEIILSSDLTEFLDSVDPGGTLCLQLSVTSVAQTIASANWVEALHNQVGLNMGMA